MGRPSRAQIARLAAELDRQKAEVDALPPDERAEAIRAAAQAAADETVLDMIVHPEHYGRSGD